MIIAHALPQIGAERDAVTMRTLLLIFSVTFASLAAHASDQLKPVFLKTNCTLKSGSVILSAFKQALGIPRARSRLCSPAAIVQNPAS
jgi:hypothetical protein